MLQTSKRGNRFLMPCLEEILELIRLCLELQEVESIIKTPHRTANTTEIKTQN